MAIGLRVIIEIIVFYLRNLEEGSESVELARENNSVR
jgi:hypothetical protein